jgi:PPM family protein phosphatase
MTAPVHSVELQIEVAQLSDPGRDPNKQINEDSCGYAVTRLGHLCVLCDGMGGHYGGQEASRRAIATIFEQIDKAPPGMSPAQALKAAVEVAGRRVYELGGPPENKARPGSTVVAMLLHDGGVDVAHVGDSRAYMVRSGQIYPVTRDHSMVQAMIDSGFITEEQAIGHPDSNKITRALGMKPDVDVDLRPEPMELFPGDLLLSTSDGLTDLALSKDILGALRQALSSGGLDHACQQLVRMANDRGGHDNITVQLVRVVGTARKKTHVGATAPGTSEASTHAGQTAWPGGASIPMLAGGAASAAASAHAAAPPHAQPGPTYAQQPTYAGHPGSARPTSVDTIVDPRAGQHTYPMHPSPTAHDGTADHGGQRHAQHHPSAMQGLPNPNAPFAPIGAATPPNPGAPYHGHSPHPPGVQPTVVHGVPMGGSAQQAASGLSGYDLSGPGGLALPPAAIRSADMQAGHHHGGVLPTPAMSPAPPPVGGEAVDPWAGYRHAPPTAADEHIAPTELQRGSSVLYLVLGASFGVAVALMLLVWHFLLRR